MLLGTLKRRGGRAALWLVVGLLVGGGVGFATTYLLKQGKKGIPGGPRLGEAAEMDLVPGDASGFIHLRLRGLWDSESFTEIRKIIDAAGPQAKKTLDDSFVPAPSTLDRMTLVFLSAPKPTAPPPKNQPRKNRQPAKGGFAPPGGFVPPFDGLPDNLVPPIGDNMKVIVLLAFSAEFDPEAVRKSHTKAAVAKKSGEREYWEDADQDVAIYFPDKTTMAIGDGAGMRAYLTKLNTPGGPLTEAITHAKKGGFHFVGALNMAQLGIPLKTFDDAPPEYKDVAKGAQAVLKMECLMIGTAFTDTGTKVEIRAKYKDDAAARESEKALRDLAAFARTKLPEPKKEMEAMLNGPPGQPKPRPLNDLPKVVGGLFGLGALNSLDEWLADPPLALDGTEVVFAPKVPSLTTIYASAAVASMAVLMPAVDKVRVSASRMKDSNNLKQLGIAMHAHHDANNALPSQDGKRPGAKGGGLSWRVHLLPYVGEENLYRQFKLDEPWDSDHNKPLADRMPAVFVSPFAADPLGHTRYKVFSGTEAVVYPGSRTSLVGITDGTSNTFMIVGGGRSVIWTKPDDIEVTPNLDSSALSIPGQTGCNVAFCDGSVRWFELARLTPEKLKAAITRSGGEVLPLD